MLLHKSLEIEIKGLAEDGTFEGWASRFGNVDSQNDIIDPAAFADDDGKEITLLDNHKADVAVGVGTVEVRPEGLWLKGRLLIATRAGMDAYQRIKGNVSKGLSVGFRLLESIKEGTVRRITRAALAEVSITSFPANPAALITAVKSEPNPYRELVKFL